jgi:type II secretory pathway pseudopilin PulG
MAVPRTQKLSGFFRVKNTAGFTLIETAAVLITASLILGFLLDMANVRIQNAKHEETQQRLDAINQKLQEFLSQDQRLPCVSSLTDPVTAATYGVEIASPDPNIVGCDPVAPGGTFNATSPGGRVVRLGLPPVRTLNLPDNYAFDAWGNRIFYAVTLTQAQAGFYISGNGGIGVVDYNGATLITPPNSQDYVLVSGGEENDGFYGTGGALRSNCAAANPRERQNCNMDTVFRYSEIVDTSNLADYFDDYVVYLSDNLNKTDEIPKGTTLPFERGGKTNCPYGWARVNPQPTGVFLYCKKI